MCNHRLNVYEQRWIDCIFTDTQITSKMKKSFCSSRNKIHREITDYYWITEFQCNHKLGDKENIQRKSIEIRGLRDNGAPIQVIFHFINEKIIEIEAFCADSSFIGETVIDSVKEWTIV